MLEGKSILWSVCCFFAEICILQLLGNQFLSHITFDFDILAILVSKHNHYELWKCVARHLGE